MSPASANALSSLVVATALNDVEDSSSVGAVGKTGGAPVEKVCALPRSYCQ